MSSGKNSDDYISRIKNETDRIKRRQLRVYEEHIAKQQQQQLTHTPEQSLPSSLGEKEGNTSQRQPQTTSSFQQRSLPDVEDDDNNNNSHDFNNSSSSENFVVHQPPDTRGESSSKLDASVSNKSAATATAASPRYLNAVVRNMSNNLQAEDHEAFRRKLIDDVLGDDSGDRVPMEKVVMLIWQYRSDPQVVRFVTRFVAKVCINACR